MTSLKFGHFLIPSPPCHTLSQNSTPPPCVRHKSLSFPLLHASQMCSFSTSCFGVFCFGFAFVNVDGGAGGAGCDCCFPAEDVEGASATAEFVGLGHCPLPLLHLRFACPLLDFLSTH